MLKVIKQYKNLIALIIAVVLIIAVIASDPLGCMARRRHERAAIRNQIAIEQAETDKRLAVIKAEKEAEIIRVYQGFGNVSEKELIEIFTEEAE